MISKLRKVSFERQKCLRRNSSPEKLVEGSYIHKSTQIIDVYGNIRASTSISTYRSTNIYIYNYIYIYVYIMYIYIYIYIYIYTNIYPRGTSGPAPSAWRGPRLVYMAIYGRIRLYMLIYTLKCVFLIFWVCILGV